MSEYDFSHDVKKSGGFRDFPTEILVLVQRNIVDADILTATKTTGFSAHFRNSGDLFSP